MQKDPWPLNRGVFARFTVHLAMTIGKAVAVSKNYFQFPLGKVFLDSNTLVGNITQVNKPALPPAVRDWFARKGAIGGSATGARKRRSPEFYRKLARLGVEARAAKAKSKLRSLKAISKLRSANPKTKAQTQIANLDRKNPSANSDQPTPLY